jgi:hypothetical protein
MMARRELWARYKLLNEDVADAFRRLMRDENTSEPVPLTIEQVVKEMADEATKYSGGKANKKVMLRDYGRRVHPRLLTGGAALYAEEAGMNYVPVKAAFFAMHVPGHRFDWLGMSEDQINKSISGRGHAAGVVFFPPESQEPMLIAWIERHALSSNGKMIKSVDQINRAGGDPAAKAALRATQHEMGSRLPKALATAHQLQQEQPSPPSEPNDSDWIDAFLKQP